MAESWTMVGRAERGAAATRSTTIRACWCSARTSAASGGVFRVTDGLQAKFGAERVFDTPISEAGIAGAAVGPGLRRLAPWSRCSSTRSRTRRSSRSIDHVAKMRERTRGRVDMPITIRIPAFGGIKGKEHHGESPETYYVHTAGLKVVVPSSPLDAYRLLRLAIADPDPVVVLEPKARYWAQGGGRPLDRRTRDRRGTRAPRRRRLHDRHATARW